MKTMMIVSSTRADYGLLYPVIREFRKMEDENFKLLFCVTGTHLKKSYGNTIDEIRQDNVRIDESIPAAIGTDSQSDIARNISDTVVGFTETLGRLKPDALMVLGDRYEILAVCEAGLVCKVPIFHIAGGDVSEGAMDDSIRHAITKLSAVHFTTNEEARKRVIQMGEKPENVHCVGSTSVDNILRETLMPRAEIMDVLGIPDEDYVLCTYHPQTLGGSAIQDELETLLSALVNTGLRIVVTKSNADEGGAFINRFWDEAAKEYEHLKVFSSLGRKRYLSAVRYAKCVIGNSSSGIIEAPTLKVPVINIGDRQKGRLRAGYVLDVPMDGERISGALDKVFRGEADEAIKKAKSPYGNGHAAEQIVSCSMEHLERGISLQKHFYEIPFNV